MNLYLISADTEGYDVYDMAVVCAPSAEAARSVHPGGHPYPNWTFDEWKLECWAHPSEVRVELLAEAVDGIKPGVVCASFNAG